MKKIVCYLLCLVMMLTVLSACKPEEHVHTFADAWQSDETDHWHQANCEHADQIKDKAPHEDLDDNDLCDVCGYAMNHEHTHSDKWSFNKTEHYHAPTCGCNANDKKYQKDNAPHVDEDNDSICDVCTYDYDHTHTYDTKEWVKADEQYHWHLPTCGHDVDGSDKEEHKDADNNGICDGCEWNYDHEHTFEETWTTDGDYHWKKPTCGHEIVGEKNPHIDANDDGKCDVCELAAEHFHVMDMENWTSDKENHWHAAAEACKDCKDATGDPIIADFGPHIEWKEDGICDTCEHIVFHLYKINVTLPEYSQIVNEKGGPILDKDGNPITLPFIVKEGNSLEFYITIPSTHRLEEVTGAEVDMVNYIKLENEDGTATYLYKISITPENDVTITATVSKLSSVEVIEEGKGTIQTPGNFKNGYYDFTFTAPETGTYVALCVENDWVTLSAPGAAVYGQHSYEFYAEAGQVVNIQASYSDWDAATMEFKYHVLRVDDEFHLPYLSGEGYTMPSKVDVTFTFTLPEPGLYLFTSEVGELQWVTPDNSSGTVEPQYFECTYAGEEFSHTARFNTDTMVTYDFDWNIIKIDTVGSVGAGDNAVTVYTGKTVGYTFTAPYTGDYEISGSEGMFVRQFYVGPYSSVKNMHLPKDFFYAGETVTLYVMMNAYVENVPTEDFAGTLSIEYLGYNPEYEDGNPILDPWVSWEYTASAAGNYSFSVPAGAYVSLNGGEWTAESASIALQAEESVSVMIKTDSGAAAKVTISQVYFSHEVTMGENAYSFFPNNEYTVTLTGGNSPAQKLPYVLSWTDTNLVVKYDGLTITSGTELAYEPGTELTVMYNGTATTEIKLTLTENYEAPPVEDTLFDGNTELIVTAPSFGKDMVYVAYKTDTYVIRPADGEENVKILVNGEEVKLPYTFEANQAEVVEFNITTVNGRSDTVCVYIESNTTYLNRLLSEMLDGTYYAKNDLGNIIHTLTFTQSWYGSSIDLEIEDSLLASYRIGGIYTVRVTDGEVVLRKQNVETEMFEDFDGFTLTLNEDGKLVLTAEHGTYVLTTDKGEDEGGSGEGGSGEGGDGDISGPVGDSMLGEYLVNVTNIWNGNKHTFTSILGGEYVITADDNGALIVGDDYNSETVSSVNVTLAAGESYTVTVIPSGYDPCEVILTVTGTENAAGGDDGDGGEVTAPVGDNDGMVVGNNEISVNVTNGFNDYVTVPFTAPATGTYVLKPAAGESFADVTDKRADEFIPYATLNAGYAFEMTEGETIYFEITTTDFNTNGTQIIDLVIEGDPGSGSGSGGGEVTAPVGDNDGMVVGDNEISVNVTNGFNDYVTVPFTAPATGTYVLKPAAGETFADVTDKRAGEFIPYATLNAGYAFEMTEGETIYFEITTTDFNTNGTQIIDLVIEGDPGDTGAGGGEVEETFDVTVTVPDGTEIMDGSNEAFSGSVTLNKGESLTLNFFLPNGYKAESVKINGAEYTGEITKDEKSGTFCITYTVENISENVNVEITAERYEILAEVVVPDGEVNMDFTENEQNEEFDLYVFQEIKYTAVKPGTYVLKAKDVETPIYVGFAADKNAEWPETELMFEVTEANTELTFYAMAYYDGWNGNTGNGAYTISRVEAFELPGLVGNNVAIQNSMKMPIIITLPKPGMYNISSENGYFFAPGVEYASSMVLEATEENQKIQIEVMCENWMDENAPADFSWKIEELKSVGSVEVGSNTVVVTKPGIHKVEFVAPLDGSYRFDPASGTTLYGWQKNDDGFFAMNALYGGQVVLDLKAGDKFTLYVRNEEIEWDPEATKCEIYVDALEQLVQPDDEGVYNVIGGVINSVIIEEDGFYNISIEGGKITTNGREWLDKLEMVALEQGDILYFMGEVEGAETMVLKMEKLVFELELTVGENKVTLVPGVEYTVNLSGGTIFQGYMYRYSIEWDETLDITMTNNWGSALGMGEAFNGSLVYITYNGEANTEIVITLVDEAAAS